MIWVVIIALVLLLCVLVIHYAYKALSDMNVRISELTRALEEKTQMYLELQRDSQEEKKKVKNLINATNTLKREIDKINNALT